MAPPAVKKLDLPRATLAETAYRQLHRKIMTLVYEPGERLDEKRLMNELEIGRTPIREALVRVAGDFMVEATPQKGYMVRPITLQNTRAAFAALRILELGVASLAVRQDTAGFLERMNGANLEASAAIEAGDVVALVEANNSFHESFAACSRNDYLIHGLYKVRCETNRLAYLSFNNEIDPFVSLAEHYHSVIRQHDAIMDHLVKREKEALSEVLVQHLEAFQKRILLFMST